MKEKIALTERFRQRKKAEYHELQLELEAYLKTMDDKHEA